MKKWLIAILCPLMILLMAASWWVTDIQLVGSAGPWMDIRAHNGVAAALTAAGAATPRTLFIINDQEIAGNTTITDNISLVFLMDGQLSTGGNDLTLQTANINKFVGHTDHIFEGGGDVDFVAGSIVKSDWFDGLTQMFDYTSDDEITLEITEAETLAANRTLGANVHLSFPSPGMPMTIAGGIVLSGVGQVTAGPWLCFTGAGRPDFDDGVVVKSSWFDGLPEAIDNVDNSIVTLEVTEDGTIDADTTVDANTRLRFISGNIATVNNTRTLTISGLVEAGDYQIFTGAGDVKIGVSTVERPVAWFGAVGDGVTNDYDEFLAALVSCSVQSGGGIITINSEKIYVLNNGANPAISLNADSLPDGTNSSGWTDVQLPYFGIKGSLPPESHQLTTVGVGYLDITGTGDGISITSSGTRKWRGKIHLENFAIDGNATADDGIFVDYANRGNTFKNLLIKNFTDNGWEYGTNNTFSNIHDNINSAFNEGLGFLIDGNSYDFQNCGAQFNGGGGIQIGADASPQGNNIIWEGGNIQYNAIPQVLIKKASDVKIHTYFASQHASLNGSEVAGAGGAIVQLGGSDTLFNIDLSGYVECSAGATSDAEQEQFIVGISTDIYGLNIHDMSIGDFSNGGFNNYMVEAIGANTLWNASYARVWYSGSNLDGEWEDTATERVFANSLPSKTDYYQIRTLLPWTIMFRWDSMADDTADIAGVMYDLASPPNPNQMRIPWAFALVGISYDTNASAGTITITESNLSLSQAISPGANASGTFRYDLDDYQELSTNQNFTPLVTTASLGGTEELNVIFYLTILPDAQDDDS